MIESLYTKYLNKVCSENPTTTDKLTAAVLTLSDILNENPIPSDVNKKLFRNFRANLQKVVDEEYSVPIKVEVFEEKDGKLFLYTDIAIRIATETMIEQHPLEIAQRLVVLSGMNHLVIDKTGIIFIDKQSAILGETK